MTARPTAEKTAAAFRQRTAVTCAIRATPERIWALLTNAADFPRWNSTVTSVEGTIALGQPLSIRVPIAPGRVFKPKVTAFEPGRSMVWSDGLPPMFRGVRTFTLQPDAGGSTTFSMAEELSGVMLPLIRGSLPDFGPAFEAYAADLKREAERVGSANG